MIPHAATLGRAWRAAYGPLPDDYLVFDLETSGFDKGLDYLIQIGWCRVANRRAYDINTVTLDWTKVLPEAGVELLRGRLAATGQRMLQKGVPDSALWTIERIKREGVAPADAMYQFVSLLSNKPVLVGHNSWRFDAPVLDGWAERLTSRPVAIPPTAMIDTAALVKAGQTGVVPVRGESYREFTRRALNTGGNKFKYSLSDFCVRAFCLDIRYGVDKSKAHDAGYDAWITHLVIESARVLMDGRKLNCVNER